MNKLNQRFPNVIEDIKDLQSKSIRATKSEAIAGVDEVKIITPKTLRDVIEANGGVGGGNTIINNVCRSGSINGKYVCTGDNVYEFTIPDMDSSKEVMLIMTNLVLIEDEQYRIDRSTGRVVLTYALMSGDVVNYQIISTTFRMEDLDGGMSIPDRIIESNSSQLDITNRVCSPVTVEELNGRTLVNLLGRSGNAIYKQGIQVKPEVIPTYEQEWFKFNDISKEMYIGLPIRFEKDKSYIIMHDYVGDSYVGNFTPIAPNSPFKFTIVKNSTPYYSNGNINTNYITINCTETRENMLVMGTPYGGSTTSKFNFKIRNVRVYEISNNIHDKINIDPEYTGAKLAEKFPYVDDVKCVVNPYIENKENLLDDVQWIIGNPEVTMVVGTTLTSTNVSIPSPIDLEPNTTYCLKLEGYKFKTGDSLHVLVTNGVAPWALAIKESVNNYITFTTSSHSLNKIYPLLQYKTESNGELDQTIIDEVKNICNMFNRNIFKMTLVKGHEPKAYEECHNSRIMFETTLHDGEKITRDNMGRYVKNSNVTQVNDILPYLAGGYNSKVTGHKRINFTLLDPLPKVDNVIDGRWGEGVHLVEYTGKLIPFNPIVESDPNSSFNMELDKELYITIPNALTGWGEDYMPKWDDIKAFFLGWRMYDNTNNSLYNRTDNANKSWIKLWCGIGEVSAYIKEVKCVAGESTNVCPTTLNNMGYTPYKLIYKRDTPTQKIIKTHGSLDIGTSSTLTTSSGLVLGESVKPNHLGLVNTHVPPHKYEHRCDTTLKLCQDQSNLSFSNLNLIGVDNNEWCILVGASRPNAGVYPFNKNGSNYMCDYLIYKPDTVTSYEYKLGIQQNLISVQDKLVEELSNTNTKLIEENTKLRNELEPLKNLSNPNLLINGDFQVWQRGDNISTGNVITYTADRWCCTSASSVTPSISSRLNPHNGLKLTRSTSGDAFIRQRFDMSQLKQLENKTITMSCMVKGSNIGLECYDRKNKKVVFKSQDITSTEYKMLEVTLQNFIFDSNVDYLEFSVVSNSLDDNTPIYIKWVKLEIGDKATPFIPKPYAEELSSCQHYFEKRQVSNNYANGFLHNDTSARFVLPYITPKRTVSTIKFGTGFRVAAGNAKGSLVSSIRVLDSDVYGMFIEAILSTAIPQGGSGCILQRADQSTDFITIDAEIY